MVRVMRLLIERRSVRHSRLKCEKMFSKISRGRFSRWPREAVAVCRAEAEGVLVEN